MVTDQERLHELVESSKPKESEQEKWIKLEDLFETDAIPPEAAAVVALALERMRNDNDIGSKNAWQAIEYWAANYLAEVD